MPHCLLFPHIPHSGELRWHQKPAPLLHHHFRWKSSPFRRRASRAAAKRQVAQLGDSFAASQVLGVLGLTGKSSTIGQVRCLSRNGLSRAVLCAPCQWPILSVSPHVSLSQASGFRQGGRTVVNVESTLKPPKWLKLTLSGPWPPST